MHRAEADMSRRAQQIRVSAGPRSARVAAPLGVYAGVRRPRSRGFPQAAKEVFSEDIDKEEVAAIASSRTDGMEGLAHAHQAREHGYTSRPTSWRHSLWSASRRPRRIQI